VEAVDQDPRPGIVSFRTPSAHRGENRGPVRLMAIGQPPGRPLSSPGAAAARYGMAASAGSGGEEGVKGLGGVR